MAVSTSWTRDFEKWNAWLNGVKVEVMVWDGVSVSAVEMFAGDEFRCVRASDRVLELGTSQYTSDRFVQPGDFLVIEANTTGPVAVISGDVWWAREALGGPSAPARGNK